MRARSLVANRSSAMCYTLTRNADIENCATGRSLNPIWRANAGHLLACDVLGSSREPLPHVLQPQFPHVLHFDQRQRHTEFSERIKLLLLFHVCDRQATLGLVRLDHTLGLRDERRATMEIVGAQWARLRRREPAVCEGVGPPQARLPGGIKIGLLSIAVDEEVSEIVKTFILNDRPKPEFNRIVERRPLVKGHVSHEPLVNAVEVHGTVVEIALEKEHVGLNFVCVRAGRGFKYCSVCGKTRIY